MSSDRMALSATTKLQRPNATLPGSVRVPRHPVERSRERHCAKQLDRKQRSPHHTTRAVIHALPQKGKGQAQPMAQTDRSVDTLAALPYAGQALAEPQALNTMLDTTTAANIKSTFFIVRLFGVPV